MCGIFAQAQLLDETKSLKAANLFSYRGPDGTRTYDSDGVTLIQHRLAIIDTRSIADQPLWSDDGTIGAVFNGEIYNFRDLKKQHFPETAVWRTEGDTEVIVRLYEKYGPSFTNYLDGMYAIVLLDKKKNALLAFRDPFGIKPLYYAQTNVGFVCASEVKGVVAALREAGEQVTPQAGIIDLYLTLGYIPSPRTVVSEVSALMPGTYIVYDLTTKKVERGVSPKPDAPETVSEKELLETLEASILRNTIADVPVGVFLSGGIDSTFIAHVLGKNGLKSQAFTMEIPGRSDAVYARAVAKQYDLRQTTVSFTSAIFEDAYATVRQRIDDPTVASSLIPTLALANVAHEQVKVILSGEGGDEIFMGYPRHLTLARMSNGNAAATLLVGTILPRRVQEQIAQIIGDASTYYALASGVMPTVRGIKEFSRMVRERRSVPVDFDLDYYLENVLLSKIDLGIMYASTEGRVPFCSSGVLAAARSAGIDVLHANGIAKAPLKNALAKTLPPDIVYRKKSGFSIPFAMYAKSSPAVQHDTQLMRSFLRHQFPERFLGLISATDRNHYAHYALLSLMHCYRNLGL